MPAIRDHEARSTGPRTSHHTSGITMQPTMSGRPTNTGSQSCGKSPIVTMHAAVARVEATTGRRKARWVKNARTPTAGSP